MSAGSRRFQKLPVLRMLNQQAAAGYRLKAAELVVGLPDANNILSSCMYARRERSSPSNADFSPQRVNLSRSGALFLVKRWKKIASKQGRLEKIGEGKDAYLVGAVARGAGMSAYGSRSIYNGVFQLSGHPRVMEAVSKDYPHSNGFRSGFRSRPTHRSRQRQRSVDFESRKAKAMI